ncbi:uncharacterized protein MONBRDRAFT_34137 [Monosiga brevicollis MX1]|uniref:Uncharacterized protein n=1 Tax=Monosiga brevicollis TaxID=81824 RepID=A9V9T0_MONBE|nr:uncharacterized protein MONBRDRAFT_34137 [Monosiga brevicollis MX1]EDQ85778.1 predicted protein [Monosiga brevicollis MX1]|eukprot:XP_001749493.1 hypothetical protein [Monosiga brevicollis MX1]
MLAASVAPPATAKQHAHATSGSGASAAKQVTTPAAAKAGDGVRTTKADRSPPASSSASVQAKMHKRSPEKSRLRHDRPTSLAVAVAVSISAGDEPVDDDRTKMPVPSTPARAPASSSSSSSSSSPSSSDRAPSSSSSRSRRRGPSKPNFRRLLNLAHKTEAEVAAELGLEPNALSNVLSNRVAAIERWAPVFAKAALTCRQGICKLLGADKSFDDRQESVGETIFFCLQKRGQDVVEQCRDCLVQGWSGWERYRLSEQQVCDFFAGKSPEAEQVADFLIKLGQATDLTGLFSLFVR